MTDAARGPQQQEQGGPAQPGPRSLLLPADFSTAHPLSVEDHLYGAWYIVLQQMADTEARIEGWSLRNVSTWLRCSFAQARRFIAELEEQGLLNYPEGVHSNRPYPVQLREDFGDPHTAEPTEPPPKPAQREKPVTATVPPKKGAEPTQQNGELFPTLAAQQKRRNGNGTNRLMELIHVMGLDEDPLCTGALWAKQAEVVKRMIEANGEEATEAAIRGVPCLFPWSEPDAPPWDAFIVERHFVRAAAAHGRAEATKRTAGNRQEAIRRHIENQEDREKAEKLADDDWQKRIKAQIKAEPEDVQWEYVRRAEKEIAEVPISDRAARKKLAGKVALRIYGEAKGDPPPGR